MGWRESINDDIGIKPYFLEKAEKALVQFQAILPSFLVNQLREFGVKSRKQLSYEEKLHVNHFWEFKARLN